MKTSMVHLATALAFLLPAHVAGYVRAEALGCYGGNSLWGYSDYGTGEDMSIDDCENVCVVTKHLYAAITKGNKCWCGTGEPNAADLVSDELCDTPCDYYETYPGDKCGGPDLWSFYIADPKILAEYTPSATTPTPVATPTEAVSTVLPAGSTAVIPTGAATGTSSNAESETTTAPGTSTISSSIGSDMTTSDAESETTTSSTATTSLEGFRAIPSSAGVSPTPFTSNANRRYQLWW